MFTADTEQILFAVPLIILSQQFKFFLSYWLTQLTVFHQLLHVLQGTSEKIICFIFYKKL